MRFAARALALTAAALAVVSFVTAVRIQVAASLDGAAPPVQREPVALTPLAPLDTAEPQLAQYFEQDLEELIPSPTPSPATVREVAPAQATELREVKPTRVRIPSIGVDASIIDLGLRRDGSLQVPWDFEATGWYTGRAAPGEIGPSIVVGHFDSKEGPAVFYDLRELEPGDLIQIERTDGLVAFFRVTESVRVDKDRFPTDEVYGATGEPTLRLITCSGRFDRDEESYPGNLLVFAEHLGNFSAGSRAS